MGFIYKGTDTKKVTSYYMTTVGNFVLPTFGSRVWPGKSGPLAYDARGKSIGRFVYAVHTDTPEYTSFGLVKLDKGVKFNPQLCHFGGPTGLDTTVDLAPRMGGYYGNGFPIDQVFPARTAVLGGTNEDNALSQGLFNLVDPGDYGAPFVTDGKAFGYWDGGIGAGTGGIGFVVSRIGPWIGRSQGVLKLNLTLQTAKAL